MHSPYAYRFVNDVIRRSPYGYYSYHRIDELLEGDEIHNYRLINLIKFTIRLAVFLKAKRILDAGDHTRFAKVASGALNLPCRRVKDSSFKFEESDLLIVGTQIPETSGKSENQLTAILKKGIEQKVPVFIENPAKEIREILEQPIPNGLLMSGEKSIVLIPRKEMEYVAYEIKL